MLNKLSLEFPSEISTNMLTVVHQKRVCSGSVLYSTLHGGNSFCSLRFSSSCLRPKTENVKSLLRTPLSVHACVNTHQTEFYDRFAKSIPTARRSLRRSYIDRWQNNESSFISHVNEPNRKRGKNVCARCGRSVWDVKTCGQRGGKGDFTNEKIRLKQRIFAQEWTRESQGVSMNLEWIKWVSWW